MGFVDSYAPDGLSPQTDGMKVFGLITIFAILILSTAYLIYSSYNPFLYFRF